MPAISVGGSYRGSSLLNCRDRRNIMVCAVIFDGFPILIGSANNLSSNSNCGLHQTFHCNLPVGLISNITSFKVCLPPVCAVAFGRGLPILIGPANCERGILGNCNLRTLYIYVCWPFVYSLLWHDERPIYCELSSTMAPTRRPRTKLASQQSKSNQPPNSQYSEDGSDADCFQAGMSFCNELTVVLPPNSNQRRPCVSLPYANSRPLSRPGILFQILC